MPTSETKLILLPTVAAAYAVLAVTIAVKAGRTGTSLRSSQALAAIGAPLALLWTVTVCLATSYAATRPQSRSGGTPLNRRIIAGRFSHPLLHPHLLRQRTWAGGTCCSAGTSDVISLLAELLLHFRTSHISVFFVHTCVNTDYLSTCQSI